MSLFKKIVTHYRALLIAGVMIGAGFTFFQLSNTPLFQTNTLQSLKSLEIQPPQAEMFLGDSLDFTSYGKSSTTSVPVKSKWEIAGTAPEGVLLNNCTDTEKCKVYSADKAGNFLLKASSQEVSITASVTIKNEWAPNPFKDVVPDWAKNTINILHSRGIMLGYKDGRFAAGDPVTRVQFTLLLSRLMEYLSVYKIDLLIKDKNCNIYSDVPKHHYAYKAVCFGHYYKWFDNIPLNKKFLPDQQLLREEAAQIVYNTLVKGNLQNLFGQTIEKGLKYALFFDDVRYDHHYAIAINGISILDIMTGRNGDRNREIFDPKGVLNRAQAATIIYRTNQTVFKCSQEENSC
jgi:hypothetical protein